MVTLIFLNPPSDAKKSKEKYSKGVSHIKLCIVRRLTKATHGKVSIQNILGIQREGTRLQSYQKIKLY
jgi:hypothetical protein